MTRTRPATPTVAFTDQYCATYRSLFKNVRHFEQLTALHVGLLAETPQITTAPGQDCPHGSPGVASLPRQSGLVGGSAADDAPEAAAPGARGDADHPLY